MSIIDRRSLIHTFGSTVIGISLVCLTQSVPGYCRISYEESELRAVETPDEMKIREIRDQEITQLRITLGRRSAPNRRADLYLRLAELYLEAYRATFLLEGKVHEKKLEKNETDPFIDRTHSKPYLLSGIQAAKEILNFKIQYDKLDQVYFFLAINFSELGDRAEATRYFETLVQKFPSSVFISEGYLELADQAFQLGQYRKAQDYYELALKKARPEMVPRLLHKLAWTYYRIKNYEKAVEVMKQAVSKASESGEKLISLRDEALKDMALFMTESGKVDEAIAYFKEVMNDPTFYPKLLEKFGKQFERNADPAKAVLVYESLLKTYPQSEASFRVFSKLVELDIRRGKSAEAITRMDQYSFQPKDLHEEETQVVYQNLKALIRKTATENHSLFRKKQDKKALESAEIFYQCYLRNFLDKDDPRQEKPEVYMYLAEVEKELGKFKEASLLYRKVLQSKDKRYVKDAGAFWISSLSEAIKKSDTGFQAHGTNDPQAQEPSPLEMEFINASDQLQEAMGDSSEGREAGLRSAEVLAGYQRTKKEALKRIQTLISKYPKSIQAVTAARLWIQIVSEHGDESEAELKAVIDSYKKNPELMAADEELGKGKLAQSIQEQERRFKIKQIALKEKEKNFSEAGKGYESYGLESIQKEVSEKAFENAVSAYLKVSDLDSIDRVLQVWTQRYPKSPKAKDSIRFLATQLLIQGKFDNSARLFERLGKEWMDGSSLVTSFQIYEGSGDIGRSILVELYYLQYFKKIPDRSKLYLNLAKAYDSQKQESDASKYYKLCMDLHDSYAAECSIRLSELYSRLKNFTEANKLIKKVAGFTAKKGEVLSPYVAYARFIQAEQMQKEAKFEPLQLPDDKLKKALDQRLQFLEPLSKSYMNVVDAGGPWAVEGLDRLAQWAMDFSEEIKKITPPAQADEKALAEFKRTLETLSTPLTKKAIDTWTLAYRNALKAEALSPALPEISDHLADLKLDFLGRAQGVSAKYRISGVPPSGTEQGPEKTLAVVRDKLLNNATDSNAWVDYGNLLWGNQMPLLAKIAYDRAMEINPKNPSALNNRGVLHISLNEDWVSALEASQLFDQATAIDEFYLAAKVNRALLLNYYRIFEKSKNLWEQILVKSTHPDFIEGLAISLQGLGRYKEAELAFDRAYDAGLNKKSFSAIYHKAVRVSLKGGEDEAVECLDLLSDLSEKDLKGFEKQAYQRLKGICQTWKNSGKVQKSK